MTLIARLVTEGQPVFVGDLATSSQGNASDAHVATIGSVKDVFSPDSEYVVTGLRQKLSVVGDSLVVAWAGDVETASTVVQDLMQMDRDRQVTHERVRQYFENQGPGAPIDQLQMIGCTREGAGWRGWEWNCLEANVPGFDSAVVGGTGGMDLRDFPYELAAQPRYGGDGIAPWQRALSSALNTIGMLLSDELISAGPLHESYGAGYELAWLHGDRFKKLEDVLHVVMTADVESGGVHFSPPRKAWRSTYADDLLVIRAASFEDGTQDKPARAPSDLYVVPPVYRDPEPEELEDLPVPGWEPRWNCNYVIVRGLSDSPTVVVSAQYDANYAGHIRISEDGAGQIQVGVTRDYAEMLADTFLPFFRGMSG